jgi:hypothetical protein
LWSYANWTKIGDMGSPIYSLRHRYVPACFAYEKHLPAKLSYGNVACLYWSLSLLCSSGV